MKNFVILSILIFGAAFSTSARQTNQSSDKPVNPAEDAQRNLRQQQEINRRFENLRNARPTNKTANINRVTAFQNINNIYRKPTKEESKLLAPEKEDLRKHSDFLKQFDSGIIKLFNDKGCAASPNVVNISAECVKFSMPGAGSSFSFRTKSYRIPRLSDLTYINNSFHSPGILSHAILVNIGDVPIENVSLQTNGLKFLNDFEAVSDYEEAKELDRGLSKGIENNGFFYSRKMDAGENTTYILRSIAYRGNNYRAVQGVVYDEFDFDERKDLTIAFRIVRRDNESVTIIWKKLAERKSPVIKRNETPVAEENKFVGKQFTNEEN